MAIMSTTSRAPSVPIVTFTALLLPTPRSVVTSTAFHTHPIWNQPSRHRKHQSSSRTSHLHTIVRSSTTTFPTPHRHHLSEPLITILGRHPYSSPPQSSLLKDHSTTAPQPKPHHTPLSAWETTPSHAPLRQRAITTSQAPLRHRAITTSQAPLRHRAITTPQAPLRYQAMTTSQAPLRHREITSGREPFIRSVTRGESSNVEHRIDIDAEVWCGTDNASIVKERTPGIPKVPATLRNIQYPKLPQWFAPTVISIGPYHYGVSTLQEGQKLKCWHAEMFMNESGQQKEALYRKIKNETPELRKCYDSKASSAMTDQKLATIFLLDGCFLLHFINYSSKKDVSKILDFTNHELAHIKQDMFLLENQLPYEVLKLLFEDAKNSEPSMEEKIKDFVESQVPFPRRICVYPQILEPCHLLHYLQCIILEKPDKIRPAQKQDEEDKRGRPKRQWCKNVQDLREVGIHFKPSPTSYLRDISFKPQFGTTGCLKIPTISMNTSTMIIFLNLIAFESSNASKNTTNNLGIISYLCFLDSLIDHWDDVKELQAAGILHNFVGEQREVAQFFNNVCGKLVPNPSAYQDVILKIDSHVERHNNSRWRKGYFQFKQKYFSCPWSFIALVGAVIELWFSGIQAGIFPQWSTIMLYISSPKRRLHADGLSEE